MNGFATQDKITLSQEEYRALQEAYMKIGEVLFVKQKHKTGSGLKTLQGAWPGVEVNDEDFDQAKASLFKTIS